MVRLATVHDYPAVSDLLATRSKYPKSYGELATWLLSATSKISYFSAMKIAVAVDKFQHIVGCMLIDEAPYFLHAKQICIAEKMNSYLIIKHMYEFLGQYAHERGYMGISLTVENSEYAGILDEIAPPDINYSNCYVNISKLKSTPANVNIRIMKPVDITQLCAKRSILMDFAKREQKVLIELSKQDGLSLVSLLEKYCGISEDTFTESLTNCKTLVDCIHKESKLELFFNEFFSEKLVYVDNDRVAGYIMFRTGDQFKHCVEITDFFISPKYVNTDIPVQLILAAGKYAATRGAHVMCGSCVTQNMQNFICNYYSEAGLLPYSFTFMYNDRSSNSAVEVCREAKTYLFG